MRRTPLLIFVLSCATLGAGCPIPQAVPEYPKGSPITPPRIVAESAVPVGAVVLVPASCSTGPTYDLFAQLVDEDTAEPVTARIFVDYDPGLQGWSQPWLDFPVEPDLEDPNETRRDVLPPLPFAPYGWPVSPIQAAGGISDPLAVGVMHVVELVVSNGFAADAEAGPMPYRTPQPGFETQVYRWVFLLVDAPGSCPP